ncbi:MAG: type II toxin-antitoxin system RelE/ParE family toxin [Rickettsiales bacterium]|nr:type II toxin-antitoxin system RelE/ParE family toxin [Rickettsiales bacterium]
MWKIQYHQQSLKSLEKLDRISQEKIYNYLNKISNSKNPENFGKALSANLKGFWRYRVGDYRIVCEIKKNELIIIIIDIGHRSTIYK